MSFLLVKTHEELKVLRKDWFLRQARVALIPTMGALHHGHQALIRYAHKLVDQVIVSIFVNPLQFAPTEDLQRYPRPLEADLQKIKESGGGVVYLPDVSEMYPEGFATQVILSGPATVGLEDQFRPHFFSGVTTIVAKLFVQCQPDYTFFGEKDYQQLKVVERMVKDLAFPVEIIGVQTQREEDGLAASSRNIYLSPKARQKAPLLFSHLQGAKKAIENGENIEKVLKEQKNALESLGFNVDYFELRCAETLQKTPPFSQKMRLLVAAWLEKTRLIDNCSVDYIFS